MNFESDKSEFYNQLFSDTQSEIEKSDLTILRLSLLRLLVFIALIVCGILAISSYKPYYFFPCFILVAVFLYLLKSYNDLENNRNRLDSKRAILKNEISINSGGENIYDNGEIFVDKHHPYSGDLDVFGRHSLYARINRCKSQAGITKLAQVFGNIPDIDLLTKRIKATQELEGFTEWRLDLLTELYNIDTRNDRDVIENIKRAFSFDLSFSKRPALYNYRRMLPLIWVLCAVLFFLLNQYKLLPAASILIVNFIISVKYSKRISSIQTALSFIKSNIPKYVRAYAKIESIQWQSEMLKFIAQGHDSNSLIRHELKEFSKIFEQLDYRLNILISSFLNLGFLWDLYVVARLNNWKDRNKGIFPKVIDIIGEFESMSSLAHWNYNHGHYCYSNIHSEYFKLRARGIGHPLIPQVRSVQNDFNINNGDLINLITGSNMSGKSTFLRTIGINMVLGNAGCRVAAQDFSYPLVGILTYMRINDALEENASTFKSELNRLEMILQEVRGNSIVFVIGDEMLRGTNSRDKLLGSQSILKEISRKNKYALIATHDLSLAETSIDGLRNYYFDVTIKGQEMIFDYKIRKGICQSFNASHLLKDLGLDIEVP